MDRPGGNKYYTPAEAAEIMKVDTKTLLRWESGGKIRAFRTLGGHRRYLAVDIDRIIKSYK